MESHNNKNLKPQSVCRVNLVDVMQIKDRGVIDKYKVGDIEVTDGIVFNEEIKEEVCVDLDLLVDILDAEIGVSKEDSKDEVECKTESEFLYNEEEERLVSDSSSDDFSLEISEDNKSRIKLLEHQHNNSASTNKSQISEQSQDSDTEQQVDVTDNQASQASNASHQIEASTSSSATNEVSQPSWDEEGPQGAGNIQPNQGPWPYISKYFKYDSHKGNNLYFHCQMCLPAKKRFSCTERSRNGLKKHYQQIHAFYFDKFKDCMAEGSKAFRSKKRHLEQEPTQAEGQNKRKELVQPTFIAGLAMAKPSMYSQSFIDDKITDFVVEDMMSMNVVESRAFNELLNLIPGHCMTRSKVTKHIENSYELQREQLKKSLSTLPCVATTADAWTCRNRSYLGMTVHWIDPETLKRQQRVLACQRLLGRHTYDRLAKAIQDIHWTFGIANNVVSTTTDNGSNFVKAFNVFGKPEEYRVPAEDPLEVEPDDEGEAADHVEVVDVAAILANREEENLYELPKHLRCAAHTLSLVATTDAEKAFSDNNYKKANCSAFGKAVSMWNKQHRSSLASDIISQEVGKLLVVPNATRWNSVYDAVVRLVNIFDKKKTGLQNACRKLEIRFFTTCDMLFFREYKDVMGPIAVALDVLQGEEKAYMGRLLPTLASVLNCLTAKKVDDGLEYCKPLLHRLIQGLKKRFGHLFNDMDCILASATHPNYRLSRWLDWLPDINAEEIRRKATNQLSMVEKSLHETESTNSSEGENKEKDHDVEDEFFHALYVTPSMKEKHGGTVKCFLREKPSRKSFDKNTFPNKAMREMFVKYNTTIPSNAAVERMFSMGKDVLRPKCNIMSDKHFEMLVFLRGNK